MLRQPSELGTHTPAESRFPPICPCLASSNGDITVDGWLRTRKIRFEQGFLDEFGLAQVGLGLLSRI